MFINETDKLIIILTFNSSFKQRVVLRQNACSFNKCQLSRGVVLVIYLKLLFTRKPYICIYNRIYAVWHRKLFKLRVGRSTKLHNNVPNFISDFLFYCSIDCINFLRKDTFPWGKKSVLSKKKSVEIQASQLHSWFQLRQMSAFVLRSVFKVLQKKKKDWSVRRGF